MSTHFLTPLLARDVSALALHNTRSGQPLATTLEPAFDSATRRKGLLGRDRMPEGAALIIAPCQAVHTFRMRFAIDLVFANRAGRVVKCQKNVKPCQLAGALRAFAVIELPTGTIEKSDTRVGDTLECRSCADSAQRAL